MAEWEGIYTIWFREAKRYVRYRSRIISSVVTPLLWLLIFGTGLGSAIRFSGVPGGYQAFIYPGIIGQTILFTAIFSGVSVIMDRQYGFLKEIMVAPVSRPSIVFGKALGIGTASIIQGVILLALSFVVGVQMTPIIFIASFLLMIPISVGLSRCGSTNCHIYRQYGRFQLNNEFHCIANVPIKRSIVPSNRTTIFSSSSRIFGSSYLWS